MVTKRKPYAFCPTEHLSVQSACRTRESCDTQISALGVFRQLDRALPDFRLVRQ